ncbi:MAG: hypothetical protein IJF03_10800 [Lachnospiraceae bacterium]|nr:hypothetical protein [Lachnospiraceae bacterium]
MKIPILTESREDVFAVPYDAIETNENGESVIYVVDTNAKEMPQSTDTEEANGEMPQAGEKGERSDMGEKGERPERGNGERPGMSNNGSESMQNKKAIVVEVGLESDYYTEISSDELKEGMLVITGTSSKSTGTTNSEEADMNGMFGGMGGNMGGGSRGGMSGGGPGGR